MSNVLILMIAVVIMANLDSIQTAWQVSLLLGAGMGVLLVLRWVWWRINAWGELTCIVVSTLLAPMLLAWVPNDAERMIIMALATTAGIVASLVSPPVPMDRLVAFYEKVRPPGFWGPVAAAASASRSRRCTRYISIDWGGATAT